MSLLLGTALIDPAEASHVVGCGTVITANTTLHGDVGPCSGDGIVIGADNITLNLNGHQIFGTPGPGDGNQAGVRLPFRTGVSVVGNRRNTAPAGSIRDFDGGVLVNGGSGNLIRDLVIRDNVGPLDPDSFLGDGIVLLHSADNSITGNVVTHNGRFAGISVLGLGSNNNEIRRNVVEDNIGISEAESPDAGFGIPDYLNAPGHGIIVSHFFDQPIGTNEAIYGNIMMNNIVRRNQGSGISTVSNNDGIIVGNIVEDNASFYYGNFNRFYENYPPSSVIGIGVTVGLGLELNETPMNVLVSNNVVNRNAIVGILVAGSGNLVRDNQVFDNGAWGISIDRATNNQILHNRTGGNLMVDLYDQSGEDPPCSTNRWWGNTYSAELQPLGIEFGCPSPYEPACTSAGP